MSDYFTGWDRIMVDEPRYQPSSYLLQPARARKAAPGEKAMDEADKQIVHDLTNRAGNLTDAHTLDKAAERIEALSDRVDRLEEDCGE